MITGQSLCEWECLRRPGRKNKTKHFAGTVMDGCDILAKDKLRTSCHDMERLASAAHCLGENGYVQVQAFDWSLQVYPDRAFISTLSTAKQQFLFSALPGDVVL